jgi:hypothetical protein
MLGLLSAYLLSVYFLCLAVFRFVCLYFFSVLPHRLSLCPCVSLPTRLFIYTDEDKLPIFTSTNNKAHSETSQYLHRYKTSKTYLE